MAAFTITSETNATQSTIKSLFEFLSNFKNFEQILPEDKVESFMYSEQECSFTIKGITAMTVKISARQPFEYLVFSSEGLAKFNFNLKAVFSGEALQKGQCAVELQADLNPFIKAMAEKPLAALVNTMSLKLSQLHLN